MDSADREALFARIMEEPEDDAPRLIYSDILEEAGDTDRAEFIRLQIRHARMAEDDPDRNGLQLRIEELRSEHGVDWINELPQFRHVHWEIFERGFISTARFEKPDDFFDRSAAVFRATPVTRLRLEQFYSDDIRKLAPMTILNHVQELDLEGGCRAGNAGIASLVEADQLKSVVSIKAPNNNLGPAAIRMLANAPFASRLVNLDVSRNDIHDDGAASLADHGSDSKGLINLRQLCVSNCRLTTVGLDAIFARPIIQQLRTLMIGGNNIGDRGLLTRTHSPGTFRRLKSLLAERCGLADASMAEFLRNADMPALEWLYLRQNNLTDSIAQSFAESIRFPKIRDLNLGDNRITRLHETALKDRYGPGVFVG